MNRPRGVRVVSKCCEAPVSIEVTQVKFFIFNFRHVIKYCTECGNTCSTKALEL